MSKDEKIIYVVMGIVFHDGNNTEFVAAIYTNECSAKEHVASANERLDKSCSHCYIKIPLFEMFDACIKLYCKDGI